MRIQETHGDSGRQLDLEGLRSVCIRPARVEDVSAISGLHTDALPHAFLPVLGNRLLRILFRAQIEDPDAVAFVAERDGEVIGYASGVLSMPAFRRRLVLRHGPPILFALFPSVLRPRVLRRIFQTVTYPEKTAGLPEAEWVFVGVKRRTAPGLGMELGKEVLAAIARQGARQIKGYVACDNRAMNSMVQRMGFEVRGKISLHDHRPSYIYVISPGSWLPSR